MREIYFDNSATTRICPAALQAYVEASEQHYGNPSSRHARGQDAAAVLRRARQTICSGIGASDGELIFVASGSEANNLAILGRAYAKQRFRGGRLLTSEGEHSSVNEPLARLEEQGFTIAHIPTLGGALDMDALAAAGGDDVILVSLMLVNNETGALYDIPRAARIIRRCCPNALLHCDATQGYMKVPFTVRSLGVDLLTLSAHKIEGPKGMGALWVAPGVLGSRGIVPLVYGGGQERGLRSGTENLPGAVAFAAAAAEQRNSFSARTEALGTLREYLLGRLREDARLREVQVNLPAVAAPHILSLTMPDIKSETMLNALSGKGIYVSSGSACSSNHPNLSSALGAFGLSPRQADCTIRVSLGRQNTKEDADALCEALGELLPRLQRIR